MSDVQTRATEEAGAAVARQLNGPLTALVAYIGEIKRHGQRFAQAGEDCLSMQHLVENALRQAERVCAIVKLIARPDDGVPIAPARKAGWETRRCRAKSAAAVLFSLVPKHKPLTKREREALDLIIQGYSNKEGALKMQISYRTFEDHRAEVMRKLGARNTADIVREALLHPDGI